MHARRRGIGGPGSINFGQVVTPTKPVIRHNGIFHCLTRDVFLFLARLCLPGRILGTQTFRAAGVVRNLPTHTFRVAEVLHFTYTHFSGGRGVAFYLHTLSGRFLSAIENTDLKFQKLRALFLKKSIGTMGYILIRFPRCARHSFKQYIRNIS